MTVDESTRHHLHQTLDQVLGPDDAVTLMEHLPPVGWADVATKADVLAVRTDLGALGDRVQAIEGRMDGLERRMDGLERRMDGLERRMDGLELRMDALERTVGVLASELSKLRDEVHGQTKDIFKMLVVSHSTMLGLAVTMILLLR